jgi:hypothetical protein
MATEGKIARNEQRKAVVAPIRGPAGGAEGDHRRLTSSDATVLARSRSSPRMGVGKSSW